MYVTRVVLENIKGFRHLAFDLGRGGDRYAGWTVFTGGNGSGKSTLLKAIAIGLMGRDAALMLEPNLERWSRQKRTGSSKFTISIFRSQIDDPIDTAGINPLLLQNFDVIIEPRNHRSGVLTLSSVGLPYVSSVSAFEREEWKRFDFRQAINQDYGWFSCGYGPYRRVFGASSDAQKQMIAPMSERFVTLFYEAASLAEVDQWLRSIHHKSLENKTTEKQQLEFVLQFLADDLLPNDVKVDRVDSDGFWLKDQDGAQLTWADMSDGYRTCVALLADILRHMINHYGIDDLTDQNEDGKLFIKKPGVVLIDEVDAHLHPSWQREIGFWLKRHFPNIQFLVTTHSPLICQAADEKGLFVLPAPGSDEEPRQLSDEEYWRVVSSRPDTILLTSAFGLDNTRSPPVVQARADKARLNSKKRATGQLTSEEEAEAQRLAPLISRDEEP